jgi:hypothetical protein
VDAMNLLGIINRGSPKLPLKVLAQEQFWFCFLHKIIISVVWVPQESNAFADEIPKMLISDDWSICYSYFNWLDIKWGPHTVDLFSSNENNLCKSFYSTHWCRITFGVNAFGYDWSRDNCWINAPFRFIGKVWRKLMTQNVKAKIIVPLWTSATWWHLIAPDALHLSEFVGDWVWLPRKVPSLFVQGAAQNGRAISPPSWQIMALRLDFSSNSSLIKLSKRNRCIQEDCRSCSSNSWTRQR